MRWEAWTVRAAEEGKDEEHRVDTAVAIAFQKYNLPRVEIFGGEETLNFLPFLPVFTFRC